MKVYFSQLIFAVCLIMLPYLASSQTEIPDTKQTLTDILDRWHRDAAAGNLDAYTGAMTPDGVYIGTDASERWTTGEFREFCKPYFGKGRIWDFKPVQRSFYPGKDGQTVWFDELLDTHMGICRGSGVLQKLNGRWMIEQYVLSAVVPNSLMKAVVGLKRTTDSLYLQYLKAGINNPEKAIELKKIFDKAGMTGTILIYDPESQELLGYEPALWDSGYLPASTFKIPNSLIGLETGVIDTSTVFGWDGKKRKLNQWEKDLNLKEAFAVSCVPCYQELARKIGPERMKEYLAEFGYGRMDVRPENIDLFWLEGNSRITPRQQIAFLCRLNEGELPVSQSVVAIMKEIMVNERDSSYVLRAKTGWAIRNGNNYGWFVGWVEKEGTPYYFATLVEPRDQKKVTDFTAARKSVTMEVLKALEIIK